MEAEKETVEELEEELDEQLEALTLDLARYDAAGDDSECGCPLDYGSLPEEVGAIAATLAAVAEETVAAVELVEAFHISGGYASLEKCLESDGDDDDGGAFRDFEALATASGRGAEVAGRRPRVAEADGAREGRGVSLTTVEAKGEETTARLRAALEGHFLFKHRSAEVSEAAIQGVIDDMFSVDVDRGERVGDVCERARGAFFVVEAGEVEATLATGATVATLGPGATFGEAALFRCEVRAPLEVWATKDGTVLWAVRAETVRRSMAASSSLRLASFVESLNRVSLLSPLTARELAFVAQNLKPRSFRDGERIIAQGDEDDRTFYILVHGHADVGHENSDGASKHIASLGPGDYFGELALLEKAPRAAHVVANGDATCVALDAEDFERVLGSLQERLTARTMVRALKSIGSLRDLPDDALASVSEVFRTRVKRKGTVLFKEGDSADRVMIVRSGEVKLKTKAGTRELLGPGHVICAASTSLFFDRRVSGRAPKARLPRRTASPRRRGAARRPGAPEKGSGAAFFGGARAGPATSTRPGPERPRHGRAL